MHSSILIDTTGGDETRILVLEGGKVQEFKRETKTSNRLAGNIYLARIEKIEPSIQAAFVDFGIEKHGFLPFRSIHPDYYKTDDKKPEDIQPDHDGPVTNKFDTSSTHFLKEFEDYTTDFGVITNPQNNQGDPVNQKQANGSGYRGRSRYQRKPSRNIPNDVLIQDVITKGQVVLVQVSRDELHSKGATLTTYISLPSRYCVLLPNSDKGFSISSKIDSPETRQKLRNIFETFNFPQGAGLIMRTINSIPPGEVIETDIKRQKDTWKEILEKVQQTRAPALLKHSSDLIETTIRDYFRDSIDEIIVEGERGYKKTVEVVNSLVPHEVEKVIKHTNLKPLFVHHGVHEDLRNLHDPRVELASGGHLVIQPTEALVSIDVNSAKSNQGKTLSETALRTNIEAAKEIARQLRLRDLAGIIVIDFIDMEFQQHRKEVETALRTALRRDQAWINCGYISKLGLLEMTRQRSGENLAANTTKLCPACSGTGRVVLDETLAVIILRHIEAECSLRKAGNVHVSVSISLENYFLNEMRREITRIEDIYGCRIRFETKESLFSQEYGFILFSPDRDKEIFRYPPKYPHNNFNSPKSTWSSKKYPKYSAKTGSDNSSYSVNSRETGDHNNTNGSASSKGSTDSPSGDMGSNKEKQNKTGSTKNKKIKTEIQEAKRAPEKDTQEEDSPKSTKGTKSKRAKGKGRQEKSPSKARKATSHVNSEKEKNLKVKTTESEDDETITEVSGKPDSTGDSTSVETKKATKKRQPSTKKIPKSKASKKASEQKSRSPKPPINPHLENLLDEIAPNDTNVGEMDPAAVEVFSPSDLDIFYETKE